MAVFFQCRPDHKLSGCTAETLGRAVELRGALALVGRLALKEYLLTARTHYTQSAGRIQGRGRGARRRLCRSGDSWRAGAGPCGIYTIHNKGLHSEKNFKLAHGSTSLTCLVIWQNSGMDKSSLSQNSYIKQGQHRPKPRDDPVIHFKEKCIQKLFSNECYLKCSYPQVLNFSQQKTQRLSWTHLLFSGHFPAIIISQTHDKSWQTLPQQMLEFYFESSITTL